MYIGKESEGLINLDKCTRIYRLACSDKFGICFENERSGYMWTYETECERDHEMARIVRYICDSGRLYV